MANELDEMTGPVNKEGRDINVIEKQIPVTIGTGTKVFIFFLWFPLIIPGLIWLGLKVSAGKYLSQLQQKLQSAASTVDNYLERKFNHLSVSFGCTGGQHRSVYFAESLSEYLQKTYKQKIKVILQHTNLKGQGTIVVVITFFW